MLTKTKWIEKWKNKNPDTLKLIENPTNRQPGFHLQRREWVTLNIIGTRHRKTGQMLYNWGARPTPECDSGSMIQTIEHIVKECPNRLFGKGMINLHMATPEAIQ